MDEQKKRLIKLLKEVVVIQECSFGEKLPTFGSVADYLLENGVLVPPCKVGDTVYIIDDATDSIVVGTITRLEQNIYTTPREWMVFEGNYPLYGELEMRNRIDMLLGKTVFLTREEAEAALKGRNKT